MKVGDYVRTKNGEIFKKPLYSTSDIIVKSSPNIIDLIEVGDYVNGFKVEEVLSDSVGYRGVDDYIYDCGEIKSIVTKEQFESMEYRIGE